MPIAMPVAAAKQQNPNPRRKVFRFTALILNGLVVCLGTG
jgi:hypothetical protein